MVQGLMQMALWLLCRPAYFCMCAICAVALISSAAALLAASMCVAIQNLCTCCTVPFQYQTYSTLHHPHNFVLQSARQCLNICFHLACFLCLLLSCYAGPSSGPPTKTEEELVVREDALQGDKAAHHPDGNEPSASNGKSTSNKNGQVSL